MQNQDGGQRRKALIVIIFCCLSQSFSQSAQSFVFYTDSSHIKALLLQPKLHHLWVIIILTCIFALMLLTTNIKVCICHIHILYQSSILHNILSGSPKICNCEFFEAGRKRLNLKFYWKTKKKNQNKLVKLGLLL